MLNKLFQISGILLEIQFENSGKTHIMFCSEEERKEIIISISFPENVKTLNGKPGKGLMEKKNAGRKTLLYCY